MHQLRKASVFSVLLCAWYATSCSGPSRVLQSISISPNPAVAKNGTAQLVATGTFSSDPVTVTPLAVNWSQNPCDDVCNAGSPGLIGPISVNSTGLASCVQGFSGTATVQAQAPVDPNLPPETLNVPLVKGTTSMTCP
jgi:hypothetical protein